MKHLKIKLTKNSRNQADLICGMQTFANLQDGKCNVTESFITCKKKGKSFYINSFHKNFQVPIRFSVKTSNSCLVDAKKQWYFVSKIVLTFYEKKIVEVILKILLDYQSGQIKKGQKFFWLHRFLNPFSQLPAVKKKK